MKQKVWMIILTAGLALSLLLNFFVIFSLSNVRSGALDTVVSAREGFRRIGADSFSMEVQVDQVLPLETMVPIKETISFPLVFNYELDTVVNTEVNLPLVGPQQIAVPIRGMIPVNTVVEIPIRLNLPISTEYHLQAVIPVEISLPPETVSTINQSLEEIENRLR
jgi:hypothetical protein